MNNSGNDLIKTAVEFAPNAVKLDDENDMVNLGGVLTAAVEKPDNQQAHQKNKLIGASSRFAIISAASFASIEGSPWLIKNIIPKAEMVMVFGPSGCGKSFFVLDLAFAIARGIDWLGNKVHQGRVVYIAAEAAGGLRKRLVAYAKHHEVDLLNIPLDIIAVVPNFLGNVDAQEVSKVIEHADLIILDTLACISPGGDENSSADMGKVLANCKYLHASTGAVIMFVHHIGKDAARGARGWSGVRAAVDAEVEVKPIDSGFQIRVTKLKDGMDGLRHCFELSSVNLGVDEDDEPINSCVIKSIDITTTAIAQLKITGKWDKNIVKAFKQLVNDDGMALESAVIDCAVNMEALVNSA